MALNMSMLSASGKLNKGRLFVANIAANSSTFTNPNPSLPVLNTAIDDLDAAIAAAADGGKSKTALMHDKVYELMRLLHILAAYVAEVAKGDVEIIHLAGMEERKRGQARHTDFDLQQGDVSGTVDIRCKAQEKTIYKWQYAPDPLTAGSWIDAGKTSQARTSITNLQKGLYWFRVIYCDAGGDHEQEAESFAVN